MSNAEPMIPKAPFGVQRTTSGKSRVSGKSRKVKQEIGFWANPGVSMLGPKVIRSWLKQAWLKYGLPIVSVGSGHGFIERYLEQSKAKPKLFCIDPDPLSYGQRCENDSKELYRTPDYPLVNELHKQQPRLVGACVLFINWAWPDLRYDYDAILALKPKAIISVYATGENIHPKMCGGPAGSFHFHRWLEVQDQYQSIAWARVTPSQEIKVVLGWWERIDDQMPAPLVLPHVYPTQSEYGRSDLADIMDTLRGLMEDITSK